jgi:hypothetical protein
LAGNDEPLNGEEKNMRPVSGLCPLEGHEAKLWVRKVGFEFDFPSDTLDRDVALLRLSADVLAQGA